jgi:hypothetical protein
MLALLAFLLAACGEGDGTLWGPGGPVARGSEDAPQGAAPDWVRAGARITYWAGAVTIEGTGEAIYVEDPAGPFHDDLGNRYRLESESPDRAHGDNAAGHGYMQVDVVDATADRVYLLVRMLVMVDVGAPPVLTLVQGVVADRATGGGLWAPLATLAAARTTRDRKVLVGPYPRGRSVYDAVVFAEGPTSRVYDRATGLLLVERMSAQSQHGWVHRNGFFLPAPPRNSGSLMLFESVRAIELPWGRATVPAAALETGPLRYEGGTTVSARGTGSMLIPGSLTIRRTGGEGTAAQYVYVFDSPPIGPTPAQHTEMPMVGSPWALGGPWLAPEAVAVLRKGQRIDSDPVTGAVLSVTHSGRTLRGHDVVTLTEGNGRYTVEWSYDRPTGLLRSVRHDQPHWSGSTTYHYDRRD